MTVYEKIFKKHGLSITQQEILDLVGREKTVLEIGPSAGYMTDIFLKNGCVIDVVETDNNAFVKIPKLVRKALHYSIDDQNIQKFLGRDYDFIIMADVLEHLVDPEKSLRVLSKIALNKTKLIVSLPNIACWAMRKQLFLRGDFEYQSSGLLDKTHLHFYTPKSLPKTLSENNWKVEKMIGTITRLPFDHSISRWPILGWLYKKVIRSKLVERFKNLSYYHFLVIASKR
ncbi:class I SAM-dependent methyltransferase [Candidatus Daviesbacteria bacterium]|nr:class I SAM-dependent methyltransferase [Candidatus Daviesbacteria bacterium]